MDTVSQALLTLLGRALFSIDTGDLPEDTDWAALYRESRAQTVHLLVYDCLHQAEHTIMPPEVEAQWKQSALITFWNNEQIRKEQSVVLDTLQKEGIPCVILKGSSSAMCYPKPELRCAGDIDLLVSKEMLVKAKMLLEDIGYIPQATPHHCHISMQRGHIVTELHFEPNRIPDSPLGDEIRTFFSGAELTPENWNGLPALPPCQRAIVLLLHKLEHIVTSGMGLRQLCDWAVFVRSELTPAVWDELEPVLKQFRMLHFTKTVTSVCVRYLALCAECAPWCQDADDDICELMIDEILKSGNFGRKDSNFCLKLFTDVSSPNRLASIWKVILSTCRHSWPVCEAHPVLLPIAPLVLSTRYFVRMLAGKRPKPELLKMYHRAAPRQKLYEEFSLYRGDTE